MKWRGALAALVLLLMACGATSPVIVAEMATPQNSAIEASPNLGDAGPDKASDPPENMAATPVCSSTDAGSGSGKMCRRPLRVSAISRSSPTCFLDAAISAGQVGTLIYPCAGGAARINFGKRAFAGVVAGGVASVCMGTTYSFSDGCTWNSAQHITGLIAGGVLTFSYAEEPAAGESGCAHACTASGDIAVE